MKIENVGSVQQNSAKKIHKNFSPKISTGNFKEDLVDSIFEECNYDGIEAGKILLSKKLINEDTINILKSRYNGKAEELIELLSHRNALSDSIVNEYNCYIIAEIYIKFHK